MTTKQKTGVCPRKSLGGFNYTDIGVVFRTDKGSQEVMVGAAWLTAPVFDPETQQQSYLLSGRSAMGHTFSVRVPADKLRNPSALADIIGHYGVHVYKPALANQLMFEWVKLLSVSDRNVQQLTLISELGWHEDGKLFYDGVAPLVSDALDPAAFHFEPKVRPPIASSGDLESWQREVLALIWPNRTLLVMMLLGLLSPFLPHFRTLSSRLVNWWGLKGSGKTLGLQVAASLFGNGIDPATGHNGSAPPYVRKFKATANAIELLFAETSPFPALLDELSEVKKITDVVDVIYLAASGMGKKRMRSNLSAATDNVWLQSIQTTSEHSIANTAMLANRPLNGGEEDRAIDIKVDALGVITDFGPFDSFGEAAGHLKVACGTHYGTAGPAIIQYFMDNREECQALIDSLPDVAKALAPPGCGEGEMRVVRHFAAALIVGQFGMLAEVFPGEPDHLEQAVKDVLSVWWATRANALQRLAAFLDLNTDQILFRAPNRQDKPVAFVHDQFVTVPDYIFEAEFGSEQRGMLKQLFGIGALIREQEGRNRHRYCDGDFEGFTFDRNKVAGCMLDPVFLLGRPKQKAVLEEALQD